MSVAALRRAGRRLGHTVVRAGLVFPAGLIGGARRYWTLGGFGERSRGRLADVARAAGSILAPSTGAPNGGWRFHGLRGGAYLEM